MKALPVTGTEFWQLWERYREYFYQRCLQWMGGNANDAEDALSQAMLQAWNKWPKYARKIKDPKVWLTRLIHNFCMDLRRKRRREATEIAYVEEIKVEDPLALSSRVDLPEGSLLDREMRAYLRHKIESLPARLRHPFVLHYCQEKSYLEIARQLGCSTEHVRKCAREARRILQTHLNHYLIGEDDTALDPSSPSLKSIAPIAKKSQSAGKSPIATIRNSEEIHYQVTVICLETLPHPWFNSSISLGWR